VDQWRQRHAGMPVHIWRRPRRADEPSVLIVEGTWHESQRPDGADTPWRIADGSLQRLSGDTVDEFIQLGAVCDLVPVRGSDDAVIVLDWSDEHTLDDLPPDHPFDNLVRLSPAGHVVWRLAPPSGDLKCFTGVRWDGGALVAFGWSWRYEIDPDSGEVRSAEFTK
jgi:hypothetical protein